MILERGAREKFGPAVNWGLLQFGQRMFGWERQGRETLLIFALKIIVVFRPYWSRPIIPRPNLMVPFRSLYNLFLVYFYLKTYLYQ